MKVRVIEIMADKGAQKALCQTPYGTVSLFWMEPQIQKGEEYHVELDNDDVLNWGSDIVPSEENLTLRDDGTSIKIVGDIDSLDPDGYMVLRLGDYIIPFLTKNVVLSNKPRVCIRVDYLKAYPWWRL